MSDIYQRLTQHRLGQKLLRALSLPVPPRLKRFVPGSTFKPGATLCATSDPNSELINSVRQTLAAAESLSIVDFHSDTETVAVCNQSQNENVPQRGKYDALLYDATEIQTIEELDRLYKFFTAHLKQLNNNGRVVIFSRPHLHAATPSQAAARRALEGFTRSLAKELGRAGSTAQLIEIGEQAESSLYAPLQFLLSMKSAYVDGQRLQIQKAPLITLKDETRPLHNKVALVTGAARGIGKAIAETLARDGASLLLLDVDSMADELSTLAKTLNADYLCADICAANCAAEIINKIDNRGLDIVVHNAGITRDSMLKTMSPSSWKSTLSVNLAAMENLNQTLLRDDIINSNGRIICISSMNGIAGQVGQTNYAASKAGIIGYVDYMATHLPKGITINAVAPGFIETQMTQMIPFLTRQIGRQLNSLSQGGLPEDVAEAVCFFAAPHANGINGQTLRVCGQCIVGA